MNFVILDLEWNSSYSKKYKGFMSEIIEFGAVKFNDKFEIVDTFSMLIAPQIAKKLTGKVKELTNISNEELAKGGATYTHVLSKFKKFLKAICGYFIFLEVLLFNRPNIIHIHSSFGPSFYRKLPFIYLAFWFKIPIINHIHGADFDEFYISASKRKKEKIKSRLAHST